jgi:YidC/Oxa1 family membrane protein insertase
MRTFMQNLFKPLVELLHWVLVNIHDALAAIGLSNRWTWGLAIIFLTLLVRVILLPLTWKQYRSAQAMQALQPKIKELQRKYKKDRQKLQQETMKLYQQYKVNPFASCLPVVLQIPVFISLYYAIRGAPYLDKATTDALANAPFLWLPHLGLPDPYYILFVVYIVTQMVSTELMMTPQTEKQQKWMMRAMPFIFVTFLYRFPSGLFVYWITTNLWTVGQQLLIRKMTPHPDILLARQAEKAKNKPGGRFMKALTQAQSQQRTKAGARREAESRLKSEAGIADDDEEEAATGAEAGAGDGADAGEDTGAQAAVDGAGRPAAGADSRQRAAKSRREASRPAKRGGRRPPAKRTKKRT